MFTSLTKSLRILRSVIIPMFIGIAQQVSASPDVMTVVVTGQAIATGTAADSSLKKNALADALYQAALKGGAKINGYSAVVNSSLVNDVLIVRPESQILDYSIISSKLTKKNASVTIRAIVGQIGSSGTCSRQAKLKIALQPIQVKASSSTPPWMRGIKSNSTIALQEGIRATKNITSVEIFSSPMLGRGTSLDQQFDYNSLTRGTSQAKGTASAAKTLTTQISLSGSKYTGREKVLFVKIKTNLYEDGMKSKNIEYKTESRITLEKSTIYKILSTRSTPSRLQVLDKINSMALSAAQHIITQRSCQEIIAKLTIIDGKLSVPFGRADGINRNYLAYTEGEDTPYEILEVTNLSSNLAQLQPIDRSRTVSFFSGKTIRFMELK